VIASPTTEEKGRIMQMADLIGTGAALCSMASFTPQIVKIWREKDATSVSLRMYLVTVTGFSLWIAYGVSIESWPVIGSNIVCLVLSALILALKLRYGQAGMKAKSGRP
jgi:MtN3 and saliva related transmembrane protein